MPLPYIVAASSHWSRDELDPTLLQAKGAPDLSLNTGRSDVNTFKFNMTDSSGLQLQLSPYTPSLTASPSVGSSASSPGLYPECDLRFPNSIFPPGFNPSRRPSLDSVASMPGSSWSASPLLSGRSSIPPCYPNTESPTFHHSTPEIDSKAQVFTTVSSADTRPKKRPKRSSKLAHETVKPALPADLSSHAPLPAIVTIPPAHASDLPFDPSKKTPGRKRGPPKGSSRSSKTKRKASEQPSPSSSAQPMKFRFVSVQHTQSTQPPSSARPDEEEDIKVEFEEHMEEEVDDGPFEHGPSELPPRPYPGGEYAISPLRPKTKTGKIPASTLDFLPMLEARFERLERAIERYVEYRAEQALRNSLLPPERCPPASSSHPAKGRRRRNSQAKLIPMSNQ